MDDREEREKFAQLWSMKGYQFINGKIIEKSV